MVRAASVVMVSSSAILRDTSGFIGVASLTPVAPSGFEFITLIRQRAAKADARVARTGRFD